jgi:LuxR family transcriptional regulator, maltose regulon positive regulatory protein
VSAIGQPWHNGAMTAVSKLSRAETDVAQQLCEGRTLAQVAVRRGVSVNTVKTQVRQIFRKLDVTSRVALVRRLFP